MIRPQIRDAVMLALLFAALASATVFVFFGVT